MYVHAVQSFIWNNMASERIKLYGTQIVKGDLVALAPSASESNIQQSDEYEIDQKAKDQISLNNDSNNNTNPSLMPVKIVESDEEAKIFSIDDLVLPLPGYLVLYPTNNIGKLYVDFMEQYGLDPHEMRRRHRETSLGGSYRRVINKPKNVSWYIIHNYNLLIFLAE